MGVLNSLSSFEKQAAFHNTTPAEVSVFTFVLTNSHQTKAITKLPPKDFTFDVVFESPLFD